MKNGDRYQIQARIEGSLRFDAGDGADSLITEANTDWDLGVAAAPAGSFSSMATPASYLASESSRMQF